MPSLNGQVVVVTGASAGIGRAIAEAFAAYGTHLVLAARRADRLAEAADACRAGGAASAEVVVTDVGDAAQVQALVDGAVERHGRLDIMINNAGFGIWGPFEESPHASLARIMAVNVNGTLYGCRAAIPVMRRQQSGRIINVSSVAGLIGVGGMAAYCATKFAQVGLGQALRVELRGSGVHCTTVLPVSTRTELFEQGEHPGGVMDLNKTWPVQTAAQVARRVVRAAKRRRPPAQVLMFRPFRLALWPIALFPGLADWLPLRVPFRKGEDSALPAGGAGLAGEGEAEGDRERLG
jgi:short-subunit dehydrogenase